MSSLLERSSSMRTKKTSSPSPKMTRKAVNTRRLSQDHLGESSEGKKPFFSSNNSFYISVQASTLDLVRLDLSQCFRALDIDF